MTQVKKRIVLHFPGFEPLDAVAHRSRYVRAASQSAGVWGYAVEAGALQSFGAAPFFDMHSRGQSWETDSRFHIVDHNDLVGRLNDRRLPVRLMRGYLAALRVAAAGGLTGYFLHAWRFGLFFIFPFLLIAIGLLLSLSIALAPRHFDAGGWSLLLSLPLAILFFLYAVLPFAARFHTLHLFSDWEMALAMANLREFDAQILIDRCAAGVRQAFAEPADEYVVSSHSMGSSLATHVIGLLLEREPELFQGKRVVFVSLGGAILQCALLRPATVLRRRVGLIAACHEISWIEVHCLTDAIHFYKTRVVALCGHAAARQAEIIFIRFKAMLSAAHYRKIKADFLRVHRQYVLGSDVVSAFDFSLMTNGPLPAGDFTRFTPETLPVV